MSPSNTHWCVDQRMSGFGLWWAAFLITPVEAWQRTVFGRPQAMCATAAWWAHIDLVAYGISQADLFAIRPDSMEEVGLSISETQSRFSRTMEIRPNLLSKACEELWVNGEV